MRYHRRKKNVAMQWTKMPLDVSCITYQTERACLIKIPQSAYKDYVFWVPKSFVKRSSYTDQTVWIVFPGDFVVTMKNGDKQYQTYIAHALSCINNPESHQINTFEQQREYQEYAGY